MDTKVTSVANGCARPLPLYLAATLYFTLSLLGFSVQAGNATPAATAPVETSAAGASAPTPDAGIVFLLDENDQPVEQPNACIQQPVIYTDTTLSVVLGYIESGTDNIVDAYGNVVGYISGPTGGGR